MVLGIRISPAILFLLLCAVKPLTADAQTIDSVFHERLSIHSQTTVINQFTNGFTAPYSGKNSLGTSQDDQNSITSTLFIGTHVWKGGELFVNPEIAGGSGLSGALGIAAATNGETFRIGNPAPQIYLARLFFRQIFPFTDHTKPRATQYFHNHSDFNQLEEDVPLTYLAITAGKVAISDNFDDNRYSHDPRTQFMCWGLMSNGAWDYPANTRGYTPSVVIEYVRPKLEMRYGFSLVPAVANGNTMNWDVSKAGGHIVEVGYHQHWFGQEGVIRLLGFFNQAPMGSYRNILRAQPVTPDITANRSNGRIKYGAGINLEQPLRRDLGCFMRASWNDGQNETWAFTEIDHSLSGGVVMNGHSWKRPADVVGMAAVVSGISEPHRAYLKAGGSGFMLGDGQLRYAPEYVSEAYYSAELVAKHYYFTLAWQMVNNPGYNADRKGPVQVFSVRIHARI